jgi:hypothetical protein
MVGDKPPLLAPCMHGANQITVRPMTMWNKKALGRKLLSPIEEEALLRKYGEVFCGLSLKRFSTSV